jgi:hypothetical protein
MDNDRLSDITPLRIGLLVDELLARKYVYDFVKWANARPDLVAITHFIIHPRSTEKRSFFRKLLDSSKRIGLLRTLYAALSILLFRAILNIELVLLRQNNTHKDHFDLFNLSVFASNKMLIMPLISKFGHVYHFSDEDIKKVKALNLDILLRCGSGIFHGDILNAATFGIISFYHADNRVTRGGPAGFWEVYHRNDSTGFILQRLTEELGGGEVLMRGHFQTAYYYLLNEATILKKSNYYLKSAIEKIAIRRQLPSTLPSVPYSNRLFRAPTAVESIIYLI